MQHSEFQSVCVVGLGYIGLPTAVVLAQHGINVLGVDINTHVVDTVNAGQLPMVEPGLDVLLQDVVARGFLRAFTTVQVADAFIIAVPTPLDIVGKQHKPQMEYVYAAVRSIAPVLQKGNTIILESTSPVGTTENVTKMFVQLRPDLKFPPEKNANIHVCYCPERVLPNNILYELVHNDRIVGGLDAASSKKAEILYKIFVQGHITCTNARTAEMVKLAENASRDVNIAFANELSMLCPDLGVDVYELIELANNHPRVNILQPGCGVGGHCLPVDPWFIVDSAPQKAALIACARSVNDQKPLWTAKNIVQEAHDFLKQQSVKSLQNLIIACIGLAYKAGSDDARNSPAVQVIQEVAKQLIPLGVTVLAVDNHVKQLPMELSSLGVILCNASKAKEKADIVCVLVEENEVKE